MTPRQKYNLSTAGWCVVATVIVYLTLAFIEMSWARPVTSEGGRAGLVLISAFATLFVATLRPGRNWNNSRH